MKSPNHGCLLLISELLPDYLTLGMESFSISDSQLTASSQHNNSYGPECARLNHHINNGAWVPKTSDTSQFLQIDTGWIVILTGIVIQGHPTLDYQAKAFQLKLATNMNQRVESFPRGKTPKVCVQSSVMDVNKILIRY